LMLRGNGFLGFQSLARIYLLVALRMYHTLGSLFRHSTFETSTRIDFGV
jgi:hypothetical protein